MIYVRVRCKRCRKVLTNITSYPHDWEGLGLIMDCSRCRRPEPDQIVSIMVQKNVDALPVGRKFEWSWMRQHVQRAQATGSTVELVLP